MAYTDEQKEKQRLYSARYRLRKKGLDLPPETLAELETFRETRRSAGLERKREASRRWNRENKAKRAARTKERYQNDPEFRTHKLALAKTARERRKSTCSEEEKEQKLRRKRENAAKACRAAAAKAALIRQENPRTPPKSTVLIQKASGQKTSGQKTVVKMPGRLLAICGWNGWG